MKILKASFCMSFVCILVIISFSYGQRCQQTVYTKLSDCNGIRVFVTDTPKFQKEGIEVYGDKMTSHLVFVEKNQTIYCAEIGFGWEPAGFVYGILDSVSHKNILLFKITGEDIDRYFDIRGQKEVYLLEKINNQLIVSDKIPEQPGKIINVIKSWHGPDSKITRPEFRRITSNNEWKEFWKIHNKHKEPLPGLDFTKCMAIVVCLGRTYNSSGVNAVDVREIGDIIRFRFKPITYQTMERIDTVTPYGIFVVPRSVKKIQLEQSVQHLIGGPEKWKLETEFKNLE